MKTEVEKAFK